MALIPTPILSKPGPARRPTRRHVFTGMAAALTSAILPSAPLLAARSPVITPRQTTGPFYPVNWSGDIDNDLVRVTGAAAQAMGTVTYITGRVSDLTGSPISGATIEIWQCDANGRYRHPGDAGRSVRRDTHFQGRGRTVSGTDGSYVFRTIQPVAYPGRTPHIHFAIRTRDGRQLITQMYIQGDPLNARDGLLQSIASLRQRASVLVPLVPGDRFEPGAKTGKFDIVMG